MKCMSCAEEVEGKNLRRFNHIFLCAGCHSLAEKAQRELERGLEQARQNAFNVLETHILKGGLLRGGSGDETTRAASGNGLPLSLPAVSQLQDAQEAGGSGVPAPEGDDPH